MNTRTQSGCRNWKRCENGAAGFIRTVPLINRAFTLIELMVVVAIIGVVLAVGAPTLSKFFHKEGFRKSVSDTMDVCTVARQRAIISQAQTEVIFHPLEQRCEVSGGASGGWGGLATTAKFDNGAHFDGLFVNLQEFTREEVARVRFFPNGTCDEMLLIFSSDKGDQSGITLEITTGLATYLNQADLQKVKRGSL